ncbi:GTP-binding protein [Lacticaseibacillus sp. GG6-2]
MKAIVAGIVAHVDAGKTTLSEAMLYQAGNLRQLGRVDKGDAFLDSDALEKARGITIFSHQAVLESDGLRLTLLDTPGHLDFASATEQVLGVLDYAILVVSATAGVQAHTRTLWHLLQRNHVPTFIFVNKMDPIGADKSKVLADLQANCDPGCLPFGSADLTDETKEAIAVLDDAVLEQYLETGELADAVIQAMIAKRQVFPVFVGSALKLDGVATLMAGLKHWTTARQPLAEFGARIFKITHADGERLTWLRVFGGTLKPKQVVLGEQKINQLRLYNGTKYTTAAQVTAGDVCVIPGLVETHPGLGLGAVPSSPRPLLQPVLTYALDPQQEDLHACLAALRELNDEDPQLHVQWSEQLQQLRVQVMGTIQLEILQQILSRRYGLHVAFIAGGVLYRETITAPVEGVGHFEPLRHYAEVHLLLTPAPLGSGITIDADCSLEVLGRNWQHQVLTSLQAKTQLGVLVGAPLTDVHITLISGRASIKHSVGGDFREATWRALRQGLMMLRQQGECQLLEPWYRFELTVPAGNVGRAMTDIQRMSGECEPPQQAGDFTSLTGVAPVAAMQAYPEELRGYTHGQGQLSLVVDGYRPAHDAQAVIVAQDYEPTADLANTPDSVFCAHGAGYPVAWDAVPQAAHVAYRNE